MNSRGEGGEKVAESSRLRTPNRLSNDWRKSMGMIQMGSYRLGADKGGGEEVVTEMREPLKYPDRKHEVVTPIVPGMSALCITWDARVNMLLRLAVVLVKANGDEGRYFSGGLGRET